MSYPGLLQLIRDTLSVGGEDTCSFVYDSCFSELSQYLKQVCKDCFINYDEREIEYKGNGEPPNKVVEWLTDDRHNVFIFGLKNSIWHTKARKKAKYDLDKRLVMFVCSPGYLKKGFKNNNSYIFKRLGEKIRPILFNAKKIKITNNAGTDLEARINKKANPNNKYYPFVEDGIYSNPGSGGDYPFGEVGFSPDQESVNGKIVFDLKIQHVGILDSPVETTIENDFITEINGPKKFKEKYNTLINSRPPLKYISEISIGLNPDISDDTNTHFIPEEKKLSTMHFGHGGNSSYGDREGPHFDGVIKNPTLFVDEKKIISDGKFCKDILGSDLTNWMDEYDCVF